MVGINYFLLTLKHKLFVLIEGLRINVSLFRIIMHDVSKFGISEYRHYQRQFFGKADRPYDFIKCWLHHQNKNKHHWEYWIPRTGHNRCNPPYPDNSPIPMPIKYVREMVADWLAASWAYEGKRIKSFNNWSWFHSNYYKCIYPKIHHSTNWRIYKIIKEAFPSELASIEESYFLGRNILNDS